MSKASSEEVRQMIHAVQPQTVFVELDAARAQQLRGGPEDQDNLKARLVFISQACAVQSQQLTHVWHSLDCNICHSDNSLCAGQVVL